MTDPLNLKKFVRTVENFPIDGITFRDITSLIETPDALTSITREFNADIVTSIESRGFILPNNCKRSFLAICACKTRKTPQ